MFRRAFAAVAASAVVLAGLTFGSAPASAAVTNANIDPVVWSAGASPQAIVTWNDSGTVNSYLSSTSISVEVEWDWSVSFVSGDSGDATWNSGSKTFTCPQGITFASPGFSVAGTSASIGAQCVFTYSNNDSSNPVRVVELRQKSSTDFWTYAPGAGAGQLVTVSFPSGVVTSATTPKTYRWTVRGIGVAFAYVSPVVPAVDSAGNPIPIITLNIDPNEGECTTKSVTGLQGSWTTAPGDNNCGKPGAFFVGYNTERNGSGIAIAPGGNLNLTFDNTLYAIYETPRTAGAPMEVVAVPGRDQISVSWKAPADPGTFPIVNYLVQASPSGRVCITRTSDADPLSCTFNLPATNTKYSFKVQALNGAGWGEFSAESAGVSPFDLVLATAERKQSGFFQRLAGWGSTISMNGRAPGYAPGTSVTPQWKAGDGNWVSENRAGVKVGSDSQISWSKKMKRNLNGRPISVRFAIGDVTSSEYSLRIGSVVGVPAAPRNVQVSFTEARIPAQRRLQVSWAAPANDGGSPITSYEVSAQLFDNSAPVTCRVNADQPLTCTLRANVRGLDRQKTYTVKVTATNARGKSKPAKADFRRGR